LEPHIIWRSEFRNALVGAIWQRSLTVEAAIEIAGVVEAMLAGSEFSIVSSVILRLVFRLKLLCL
jgi:hypothetical protein